ncbi:MAG: hypothetical protein C5B48_13350 [Candidatus Rokuibacteriota bacterium]|nr:MAG: hypothetical protein C5B48_13350 [Candidatus Rokubacteria bacterium]
MTNHRRAVLVLLLVLLVAFPLLALMPDHVAAVRLAGLSLLWWYGGVIAPLLACLIGIMWLPEDPPPRIQFPPE